MLPMAQTYAMIFVAPLLITMLAIPILGETVGWRRSVAVLVGLIGVIVVLRPGSTALPPGHLAALTAAVFSAIAAVIVRKIGHEERSAVLLLYPMVANFLIMACAMPFVYQAMPAIDLGALALMACLGFLAALCHIAAYRTAAPSWWRRCSIRRSSGRWSTAPRFFDETPGLGHGDRGRRSSSCPASTSCSARIAAASRSRRPVLETQSRFVTGTYPRISSVFRLLRKAQ